MSDSNGSGVTADGRFSYSYSINAISSNVEPNSDYPQCPPIRVDNYKALITLTPTASNLSNPSVHTIVYQPSVATQSTRRLSTQEEQPLNLAYVMPTQSKRYSIVQQQGDEQPLNLAYVMPSQSSAPQSSDEQPANLVYALPTSSRRSSSQQQQPTLSARRISVVQQEPAQSWAIASNNSFETVNNNNNNSNGNGNNNSNTTSSNVYSSN